MPISHVSEFFQVIDCRVSALTADPSGGPATYGTSVQVPGIKTVAITPTFNRKELRGAGQMIDVRSKRTMHAVTITFAEIGLDALAVMTGDTVVDSGVTPNQVATYSFTDTGVVQPFFKLEAQTDGVDTIGGDAHIVLYKCVLDAESIGFADEDFHTFSAGLAAFRRKADNKAYDIVLNQTKTAIA